jgi:hypothetical protein
MIYAMSNIRIRNTIFFFLLFALLACETKKEKQPKSVRIPGEFEPIEAIWLGYKTLENYDHEDSQYSVK